MEGDLAQNGSRFFGGKVILWKQGHWLLIIGVWTQHWGKYLTKACTVKGKSNGYHYIERAITYLNFPLCRKAWGSWFLTSRSDMHLALQWMLLSYDSLLYIATFISTQHSCCKAYILLICFLLPGVLTTCEFNALASRLQTGSLLRLLGDTILLWLWALHNFIVRT